MARMLFRFFLMLVCLGVGRVSFAQEEQPARLRVTCSPMAESSINHRVHSVGESWNVTLNPDEPTVLRLAAPGYQTQWRTVRLGAGDRRHEAFRLKHEPIPVLFRSENIATVLCDGAELGTTPLSHFFPEPRAYRIVFRADGCQDQVLSLRLLDGKPRVIDADLLSDSGSLQISTNPSGATVLMSGVEKGTTPCTLERIREGEHTLTMRLEGYKPLTHKLKLAAGETIPLSFNLERLPSGLTVTTLPEGARIYVDGVFQGESDLTLPNLSPGAHSLRAEMPGYATESRSILLNSGTTQVEEFRMQIVRGSLTVRTQPEKVAIWQGTKRLATTAPAKPGDYTSQRTTLALPPGTYTLTFTADGYHKTERKVTIEANKTAELNVRLTFAPNFEVVTRSATYRGVLVRQTPEGHITLELKPGTLRTFKAEEIVRGRFL